MALLELENFSCGYGQITAASDLSFAVEAGQILALPCTWSPPMPAGSLELRPGHPTELRMS
jgi:hypothetical protein